MELCTDFTKMLKFLLVSTLSVGKGARIRSVSTQFDQGWFCNRKLWGFQQSLSRSGRCHLLTMLCLWARGRYNFSSANPSCLAPDRVRRETREKTSSLLPLLTPCFLIYQTWLSSFLFLLPWILSRWARSSKSWANVSSLGLVLSHIWSQQWRM